MINDAKIDFTKIIPFEIKDEKGFAKAYQYLNDWYRLHSADESARLSPNQYTGTTVLKISAYVPRWFKSAMEQLDAKKIPYFDYIDYVVRQVKKQDYFPNCKETINRYFNSDLTIHITGYLRELQQKQHLAEVKKSINTTIKYIICETTSSGYRRTWDWFKNEVLLKRKLGRMIMAGKISIYFLPFIHNFDLILDKVYTGKSRKDEDFQYLEMTYLSKASIIAVDTKATFPLMKKKFGNVFDFCDETMNKAIISANQNQPVDCK